MTRGHLEAVEALAPEVANRAVLIDPDGKDVSDPIRGDLAAYQACARHLERAVAHRIQEIA
jgi:protein-tyrosine-phosphatase